MIELKDAIEISRILAKAPQERLPMILSVFEKADLSIEGIEELEAWAISKDRSDIIELNEFMTELESHFRLPENDYKVIATDFTNFCTERKLDAKAVRRWLARRGIIKTEEYNGRTSYTITQRVDGKTIRCIFINKNWREFSHEAAKKADVLAEGQDGKSGT